MKRYYGKGGKEIFGLIRSIGSQVASTFALCKSRISGADNCAYEQLATQHSLLVAAAHNAYNDTFTKTKINQSELQKKSEESKKNEQEKRVRFANSALLTTSVRCAFKYHKN